MVTRVIGTSGPQVYTQQEAQELLNQPIKAGTLIFISDLGDAPGQLSVFDGTDWKAITSEPNSSPDLTTFNIVHVAKNGDDTNGNGTISKPFLTIMVALQSLAAKSADEYVLIQVGPGVYDEVIEMNRPRTIIKGENGGSLGTQLHGSVIINPSSLEGNNYTSVFALDDIVITQAAGDPNDVINLQGNFPAYVRLRNVKIVSTAGTGGLNLMNTSSTRSNIYLENVDIKTYGKTIFGSNFNGFTRGFCALESTGDEAVSISSCSFTFNAGSVIVSAVGPATLSCNDGSNVFVSFSSLTNNSAVDSGASVVNVTGTGKLKLADVHFFTKALEAEEAYTGYAIVGDPGVTVDYGNLTFFGNNRVSSAVALTPISNSFEII